MEILKTIPFSELLMWDVKRYQIYDFYTKKYPKIELKNLLIKHSQEITLDDNEKYKQVTIKLYGKGVVLRQIKKGIEIKTKKQFLIRKGQLIYSKIDARNGAFGIVPEELDGAIITNSFSVFDINKNLVNPQYLFLVTSSRFFQKICERFSSGTTGRRNINDDTLLNLKIPLPSLEEQNRLVANYNTKIKLANDQEKKTKALEQEIEAYLFEVLGIEKLEEKETKKGLQFVLFKNTSRWDTLFLIGHIPILKSKFEILKFSDVILNFNKDTNNESVRINTKDYPDKEFHYIGMEHIEKETGKLLELKKVKGKEIKSQTLKVPKEFYIYGKLRPYLNKYWINETDLNNIICSSEFFVFNIKEGVDKYYFLNVLSSQFIQTQISDKTSGARMPRINEEIFFNLQFPLPPLKIQKLIANHISALKQQINDLLSKANENREKAIQEFEEEIFTKN